MATIVVARDLHNGIGKDGKLPWPHSAVDMNHFVRVTTGKPLLMGVNTALSLPNGPLPGRTNYVVVDTTKKPIPDQIINDTGFLPIDVSLVRQALEDHPDMCVIGGSRLYSWVFENYYDLIDTVYVTTIYGLYECDSYCDFVLADDEWSAKLVRMYDAQFDGVTFADPVANSPDPSVTIVEYTYTGPSRRGSTRIKPTPEGKK